MASNRGSVLLLPWRLIRWRISVTLRLLRAIGRHPFWVFGGAFIGYVALIPLALPVVVGLAIAGVTYDDQDAAWVLAVLCFLLINAGGFIGYKIGERRAR